MTSLAAFALIDRAAKLKNPSNVATIHQAIAEIERLERQIEKLSEQVEDLGGTPDPGE